MNPATSPTKFTLNGLLCAVCTTQNLDQVTEFLSEMIFPSVLEVNGHSGFPIIHSVNVTMEVFLREAWIALTVLIEVNPQLSKTKFMKEARLSLGELIAHIESDKNSGIKKFHPLDLVKIY